MAWSPQGDTSRGSFGFGGLVAPFATRARNQITLPIERNVQQCTRGVETCIAWPKGNTESGSRSVPRSLPALHHRIDGKPSCRWFAGNGRESGIHGHELFRNLSWMVLFTMEGIRNDHPLDKESMRNLTRLRREWKQALAWPKLRRHRHSHPSSTGDE